MTRLRKALVSFAVSFGVGTALGRLFGDRSTGRRAGLALGTLAAVAALARRETPVDIDDDDDSGEPIEIDITE